MKTKKYIVSNPLVANATGKTVGKQIKLEAPKLPSTGTGSTGSESQKQKPYTPVKCEMWTLPKYYLPDIQTASGYRKNEVNDVLELFKKYPNLDYVSAYTFSTKDSEVNKAVWKRFLELYDQGYIKRIYDKINGYFENGLQNYVKTHSQAEIDSYFPVTSLKDSIKETITTAIGFYSDSERQRILLSLIYDFLKKPNELYEAMYANAKQHLINEAKYFDPKITGVTDDPTFPQYRTDDGKTPQILLLSMGRLAAALNLALINNQQIYTEVKKRNDKLTLYTVALKDNLSQLNTDTKKISENENEDEKKDGDYPTGNDDDKGNGTNKTASDSKYLLLGAAVLVIIFFAKRKIRQ